MLNEGRCAKCKQYRVHLSVKRSRNNQGDENAKIAHDSHTTYANLPREELVERLRNTQKEKQSLKAKCTYLSGKLRKIVKKEGIRVSSEDSEDLSWMMDELSPIVDEGFDRESPQYLLWQEQLKYNNLKKSSKYALASLDNSFRSQSTLFFKSSIPCRDINWISHTSFRAHIKRLLPLV